MDSGSQKYLSPSSGREQNDSVSLPKGYDMEEAYLFLELNIICLSLSFSFIQVLGS